MALAVALVVAALVPARPAAAQDEAACVAPHCLDVTVPVPAGLKVPDPRVRVLLPEGYADGCLRYPVLYLLHGVGDGYDRWTRNTDVADFVRNLPVIVVMPDGGRTPEAGWYSDWVDGSRQWETFHMKVLVTYVDATYRTLGDGHRLVAGNSMGGFGTMSYAARHPGVFAAAASFSGMLDNMFAYPASGPFFAAAREQLGTPDDRVWGNQVADEATWRDHNPTDRAEDLAGTALFLTSGMGVPGGPAGDDPEFGLNYGSEAAIFQMNLNFVRELTLAGIPFTSDFTPGYHGWPYWERALHWALPQMLELVGPAAGTCPAPAHAADAPGPAHEVRAARQARLPATGAGVALLPGLLTIAGALVSRRLRRSA